MTTTTQDCDGNVNAPIAGRPNPIVMKANDSRTILTDVALVLTNTQITPRPSVVFPLTQTRPPLPIRHAHAFFTTLSASSHLILGEDCPYVCELLNTPMVGRTRDSPPDSQRDQDARITTHGEKFLQRSPSLRRTTMKRPKK